MQGKIMEKTIDRSLRVWKLLEFFFCFANKVKRENLS